MEWTTVERYREWTGAILNREEKEAVAERVAERVRDGQVIGVGSGSTAFVAIHAIAARVAREGLAITAVPTSVEVAQVCAAVGIPTAGLSEVRPEWGFDGADEVDDRSRPNGPVRLIKGRGGAMFREKLVMASQAETLILVDGSKRVDRLGERFPVPVETHPAALHLVEERLVALGAAEIVLRPAGGKDGPVITESGNLILDARFGDIPDTLEADLAAIPGVIETGLFIGYPVEIVSC
ncbi:MAG: ribose 5-phosphate isomerase A [Acidobacteriota bacterium]